MEGGANANEETIASAGHDCKEKVNWHTLDGDILLRLKNNDPGITALALVFMTDGDEDFDALSIDWEKEGRAIADNTRIKSLAFHSNHYIRGDDAIANAKAIYSAVSRNRSIQHLYIMDGCLIDIGAAFTILSPLFEHNDLRSLIISENNMNINHIQHLAVALSKCNKQSLRHFAFECCHDFGLDDESATIIVNNLQGFHNLRELELTFNNDEDREKKWCVALGNILQNPMSKLEVLSLDRSHIDDEGVVDLGTALGKNNSIKKLHMTDIRYIAPNGWSALFRGLSNIDSLEEVSLYESVIGNKGVVTLSATLANCKSLKSLDLSGVSSNQSISSNSWEQLFTSILTSNDVLEKLVISDCNLHDQDLYVLGDGLSNNSTLKGLNLGGCRNITSVGWVSFFRRLANPDSSLEKLYLYNDHINDEALATLANVLSINVKFKYLNLGNNQSISSAGWQTFFTSLQNHNLELEELILHGNNIDNTGVLIMVNVLNNMDTLKTLRMSRNSLITSIAWMALSTLLQRPASGLTELDISGNNANDDVLIGFANALLNNKSLTTFFNLRGMTSRGWVAFTNLLCNKSSIASIYNSNHTLQSVGYGNNRPVDLISYLELNNDDNKREVARQKILRYHFSNGEDNIEEFVDMDVTVIPHALAWMCRNGGGRSLLYNVLRSLPTLFDSDANAKAVAGKAGTKRKVG